MKTLKIAVIAASVAIFWGGQQAKAADLILKKDNTRIVTTVDYTKTNRPPKLERLFTSKTIEKEIEKIKKLLTDKKLAWMFENCFPNTLDTTVHYRAIEGDDDTFVYTGDIHAMWLRDSGAQVWPYVQ
ncbi:MAG: glycoside hydrolase family 125 protein, partial [Tannerella sp.]|nr:glycoside hydrolase family 125 protein [Tannerella sp.]